MSGERIQRRKMSLTQISTSMHTWMCPFFVSSSTFFAEYTDKLDICSLFQIAFHTQAGISMRTTEKARILPGAAFYFQFVFICPSAPHGCLWERVSTCFIGRYCVSGSKSVFTHRCESRTSVSVPLLFVSGWNYLGVNGFVCLSICIDAGDAGCTRVSTCVSGVRSHTVIFYIYLFVQEKMSVCVYEVYQSTRWSKIPSVLFIIAFCVII